MRSSAVPFGSILALSLALIVLPAAAAPPPLVFTKYFDKTEGAFFVLVPKGWITRGSMVRVNPLAAREEPSTPTPPPSR